MDDDVTSDETTGARQATQTKQTCLRRKNETNILFWVRFTAFTLQENSQVDFVVFDAQKEARFCKEISSLEEEQFSFWSVGNKNLVVC